MHKVLVAGIVGLGLLAGCSEQAMKEEEEIRKNSRTVFEQGEILSTVAHPKGSVIHTVKYQGKFYQCSTLFGLGCSPI